jgi:hypothetical protein
MNTTELQEIQMYNANRKMHEDQHHKVPLRIEHSLPLIVIFSSGFLTGMLIVGLVMGALE